MKITRSEFFQFVAGGSTWLVSSGFAQKIALAVPDTARPLPLTAVRLTGGPLKRAQDLDTAYLLSLDPDRMLAFYRKDSRRQLRSERPVVTVVHAAQDLRRPARCVSPHR